MSEKDNIKNNATKQGHGDKGGKGSNGGKQTEIGKQAEKSTQTGGNNQQSFLENTTSSLLNKVVEDNKQDIVKIREIKKSLQAKGFAVLLIVFCLPVCIPFPAPPFYTTIFAIPLLIISAQMIWQQPSPWLPKFLDNKGMKRTTLATIVQKSIPILRGIEKLMKKRLAFSATKTWEKILGIFIFTCGLSILNPIPLTNLVPAYAILIMSLGLLAKDGLAMIIGMLMAILGIMISIFATFFGGTFIKKIFGLGS